MTEELVRRTQRGEHAAFELLAAAAVDRLYAVAQRVLRDQATAEDAVQECLFRAWRDARALRDPARWDAWLYRLLMNACRDEQRRSRRRPVTVAVERLELLADSAEIARFEGRDELERGFRQLTVEHRMALAMHFYLGLRPVEIARTLGIPEGTATSRIHYASRALRSALEADLRPTPSTRGAIE